MAKVSFAGWKDPVRRPRYIIWMGVGVLVLAAVMVIALSATSTFWFCSSVCHKVQDDTIIAYDRSTHNKVSCMACHEPVNANPVVFILKKAEALGELYLTATNKYELPLNPHSTLALELTSERCTQCHSENRVITPTAGIIIDHAVHEEKEVQCTYCHNRIAHNENFQLTLTSPNGEPNHAHPDYMTMTACFRCHMIAEDGVERPLKASGKCTACHPANFQFKPASHLQPGFFPKEHAKLASEAASSAAEGKVLGEELKAEEGEAATEELGLSLPRVEEVNYCFTCHNEKVFCNGCHGMEMPHPAEFKQPKDPKDPQGHPVISKLKPDKCEYCHQVSKTDFCNKCHHGTKVGWTYNPAQPWQQQHAQAVSKVGLKPCTAQCHTTAFCANCHTKLKPIPTSHKDPKWLHNQVTVTIPGKEPAKPTAVHATTAQSNAEVCAICHGDGGPNGVFCKNCHQLEVAHPDQFKQFHSKTGKSNPALCSKCHQFREICSNCHHIEASLSTSWISVHGPSVAKNGAAGCIEKCHKKADCVACHTSRKVVPGSHRAAGFTRSVVESDSAGHVQLYEKNAESCTFCHGDGGANSPFCKGCHKLDMPHQIDEASKEKFPHKAGFANKQLTKAQCVNCHSQYFCDSCHHQGAPAGTPWLKAHPAQVKQTGAEPCFECHKETFCSYCHVRLNK